MLFSRPVDKHRRSLFLKATFPLGREQRCKVQTCKARHFQVAGRYFIFISFQKKLLAWLYADRGKALHFYVARFYRCLQEANTNATHPWFVCGVSKCVFDKVYNDCRQENGGNVGILSLSCFVLQELLLMSNRAWRFSSTRMTRAIYFTSSFSFQPL